MGDDDLQRWIFVWRTLEPIDARSQALKPGDCDRGGDCGFVVVVEKPESAT